MRRSPVDIVLLSYNRPDYLEEMVDALERNTRWPYRLTIVDNASGPVTRQWLRDNEARLHQVIWNRENEHLAGHQRGIAATTSELLVISDADLLPHEPTGDGCWLTRMIALAGRHPDFGMIGARLDQVSESRNAHLRDAPVVDGEIIEAATGVWLNLLRREALRVPFMSDGITNYALRRAGYRVGIAADIYCTHLGDQDPIRHPEYLARKQSANGLGTVYPDYTELADSRRPPTLAELAHAAPILGALTANGIAAADTVELSREAWPPVGSVEPSIESCRSGEAPAAARWVHRGPPPLTAGGAEAVVLACARAPRCRAALAHALACAREWVVLLTPETLPEMPPGWSIADEQPGPHPVVERLAAIARLRRWRGLLGYTTSEHTRDWLRVFRASCFGEHPRARLYVMRRTEPLPRAAERWSAGAAGHAQEHPPQPAWRAPVRRSGRFGALVTKASRLVRAEWHLLRRRSSR